MNKKYEVAQSKVSSNNSKKINHSKANNDYQKKSNGKRQNYAKKNKSAALQLLNLEKAESRTYTVYSKEDLRTFIRNPKQNESRIRNLARFLVRYSFQLQRLIHYYAEMVCLDFQCIIPQVDITTENDPDAVLKSYYETAKKVEQMDLANEIYKLLTVYWREGVVYAYVYDDDKDGGFFFHVLDADYCRVSSIENGICNFAYDFSYFRRYTDDLEYWDSEFKKKYNAYQEDSALQWQELDPARTICLKFDMSDPKLSLPVFLPIFELLISLVDLQSIEAVKDQLSIYKLLVAKMETLSGTNESDDFKVDPDTALEYYYKLCKYLPPEVAACLSPLPLDVIDFKGTTTDEENALSKSIDNVFKTSGGAQILNSDKISGSTAFKAAIIADTEMGLSSVLPQIQKWVNRYLTYKLGEKHAKVKYLEASPYTKADKKSELITSGQNGVPVKLAVASLDGFSPLECLSLDVLENSILKLQDSWVPFNTSYVQSGSNEKDDGDLTDEGAETKDQEKNKM